LRCVHLVTLNSCEPVPYRIQAVNLTTRRPGFDPMPTHDGFVVDKVAVVNVFYPNTSILANQYRYASLNDGDTF